MSSKYNSLEEAGKQYIESLEFIFCPLEDNREIEELEKYLISKIKNNNGLSDKYFFINDYIPSKHNFDYKNINLNLDYINF